MKLPRSKLANCRFPPACWTRSTAAFSRVVHICPRDICVNLCEVTDERWRPAIEVAFARKFAIVVSPEHYEQAEKIYHRIEGVRTWQRDRSRIAHQSHESAEAEKTCPVPVRSLEKLKSSDPVAEAIVSQLFGDLMCVESARRTA